ncbi:MAG: U32 family peptidase [Promethearchaeota archaeon]|nr:MAG: U32 family peptidase [Candidatus Lokiarchaeota archaeon]
MENRPELLAPVQDWRTLKFIKDIPDAIYFGVQSLNMRQQANNFLISDLERITDYCHSTFSNPIKCYLCTNILVYNSELEELRNLISQAKSAGIDGLIVYDFASIKYAKEFNMEFHISTQANISNIEAARHFERLGAKRLILARELSLEQIMEIRNQLSPKVEIECFIHGAMCTAISGRCYLSASVCDSSEYSANRGKCIQPCRREWQVYDDQNHEFIYDGQLFLNAKDLCMIKYIPQLIEANIDVFKIEGRMKDPLYVKTVVECYRDAINSYYNNSYSEEKVKIWLKKLSEVYNRGFHTGFYFDHPDIDDIELKKRGNVSKTKREYIGRVQDYHENSKTAKIVIEKPNLKLKKGEKIIISNKKEFKVLLLENIFIKGTKVDELSVNKENLPLSITIGLNESVNFSDKIYIIEKHR